MTEPIYSYKKGEGWVPSVTHSNIKVNWRGDEYLVEHRIPLRDELYIAFDRYTFRKLPTESQLINEVNQHRVWGNKVPGNRAPNTFEYFTLVPL